MPDAEILIVGGSEPASEQGRVVARVEPHIVVVQVDVNRLPQVAHAARFAISRDAEGRTRTFGDERVLDELDEGARLFVHAWREQPTKKSDRPGEGLSWGATGFQPPDRPTERGR